MDTSGLRAVIPDLVAYGRRTVAEQCVTSMGMILQDTQNFGSNPIPFVDVGRMDQELDAIDHVSKSKVDGLSGLPWTEAMMIAVQRTNPNSKFSVMTGNRWPLMKPGFPRGSIQNWRYFANAADRMTAARHSSGHFIQSGFKGPIEQCITSALFKNRYRARTALAPANPLNTLDPSELGRLDMASPESANFQVTAENNIGENGGNAVLDAKHAEARDAYASGPLQGAIDKETAACDVELERRIAEKWPVFNKMLS